MKSKRLSWLLEDGRHISGNDDLAASPHPAQDCLYIYQIDSPYLDSGSNGLSYLVDRFKGLSLYGHITLSKTIRSPRRRWLRNFCR